MREGLLAQGSAGSLSDNTGHLANPPSRQVAYLTNPPSRQVAYLQSCSSTQIDAEWTAVQYLILRKKRRSSKAFFAIEFQNIYLRFKGCTLFWRLVVTSY